MTRALSVLLVAAALATATTATGASAAEPKRPSAGLRAYGLDWIQYLRPKDLPPTRYAVCIVDTGVAITPDTPPDNPNGPIIKRLSIDGGSGEPQGTTPAHLHGTRMAMTAVAPRNGWGTVGMFPQGRIISVRATVEGESTFGVAQYVRGIRACLKSPAPIAAINLSIGCGSCEDTDEFSALTEAVQRATERGIAVVVAAGNSPGPLRLPANAPGVLPIGAGGLRGKLCPYSAWSESVTVLAPACPVASAEPLSGAFEPRADGGTSTAAVEYSALSAALRTLRPEATRDTVLAWTAGSATRVDGRRTLAGRRAAAAGRADRFVLTADRTQRAAARR